MRCPKSGTAALIRRCRRPWRGPCRRGDWPPAAGAGRRCPRWPCGRWWAWRPGRRAIRSRGARVSSGIVGLGGWSRARPPGRPGQPGPADEDRPRRGPGAGTRRGRGEGEDGHRPGGVRSLRAASAATHRKLASPTPGRGRWAADTGSLSAGGGGGSTEGRLATERRGREVGGRSPAARSRPPSSSTRPRPPAQWWMDEHRRTRDHQLAGGLAPTAARSGFTGIDDGGHGHRPGDGCAGGRGGYFIGDEGGIILVVEAQPGARMLG